MRLSDDTTSLLLPSKLLEYSEMPMLTIPSIRYHSIPDRQKQLAELEKKEAERGGVTQQVTPDMIAEVVAKWTGVPVSRLVETEKAKLLRLEKLITKKVIGQPEVSCHNPMS